MVKGSSYGFVVTGTTAEGHSWPAPAPAPGTSWLPTGPLGHASVASVSGATVRRVARSSRSGRPPPARSASNRSSCEAGHRRHGPVGLAGLHRWSQLPEMKINSTAVAAACRPAVGSANGYPAVWRRTSAGAWTLVPRSGWSRPTPPARADQRDARALAGLAVGAPGPVVLTSADGEIWGVAGDITQDLAGVSAVAATSGPPGTSSPAGWSRRVVAASRTSGGRPA